MSLFSNTRASSGIKRSFWGTLVLLLMLSIRGLPGAAETDIQPSLSVSIDKTSARIGDFLWVTLTYELPEDSQFSDSAAVGGLETLTLIEQRTAPNQIKFKILVDQLRSFDLGPFSLRYIDHEKNEQQVSTDPIPISILSNLGDKPEEAALKPIQDIISTARSWRSYLIWTLVSVLLLGMLGGLIWWRKNRRNHDMRTGLQDPPHVQAEKEIDALIASGLFEKGDVKTFYFSFSETIRRYMESIRSFPAAEMTTEEIAGRVRKNPSDNTILPLLRQADLVKFADAVPAPDRKDQDILMARAYIQQTTPMTNKSLENNSLQEGRP